MGVYDDLGILRAFVCIVESGSISAAARKLHVTQPTLSRQLQSLEAACGTSLLRRDTHRMHLTDAGHRFAEDARVLLSLAEESEQRLFHNQSELRGNVRIFSTIDFGQSVVSRLCAAVLQAHPGVTVELAYSNRPLHMIEEECDAGIIAGHIADVQFAVAQSRLQPTCTAAIQLLVPNRSKIEHGWRLRVPALVGRKRLRSTLRRAKRASQSRPS
jgi:DNA-binding transcriptional LysR family regulator